MRSASPEYFTQNASSEIHHGYNSRVKHGVELFRTAESALKIHIGTEPFGKLVGIELPYYLTAAWERGVRVELVLRTHLPGQHRKAMDRLDKEGHMRVYAREGMEDFLRAEDYVLIDNQALYVPANPNPHRILSDWDLNQDPQLMVYSHHFREITSR
jgi:hypothetical protein